MKTGCLCLLRRRPEEHNSAFVWPLQRGKHEETTSITLLMCSLHHSVGLAGQGWLLCFLCRDQDVSSTTAGMLNIFVHFSSPVSKLASVLLNWVFMDILDLLFRSCIQKNNKKKTKCKLQQAECFRTLHCWDLNYCNREIGFCSESHKVSLSIFEGLFYPLYNQVMSMHNKT